MRLTENNFQLDNFQKNAIKAVESGRSVLVSAPTGAGKTLIAEYLIKKCLEESRGVIYTAPIKALSNQKYRDFEQIFPGKVGIITGDVNINPHAPLLIMTTEIFRNRILENPSSLDDHHWVIYDEIHYLDDLERGTVWEESLIFLPQHMKFVGLSATIPNIKELADWLKGIHTTPLEVIKESKRPVPLRFLFQCRGKILHHLKNVKQVGFSRKRGKVTGENKPITLIRHLVNSNQLPCIYFSFSRKRCEFLAKSVMDMGFVEESESEELLATFDDYCIKYNLTGEERTESLRNMVAQGIAYHHAGIHPLIKEILERLFTARRIKIIFTTETFALGINMPARTVILDELRKNYGKYFRSIKVRDFFQMAGRSGRRGIDKEGFVYSRVDPRDTSYQELETLFRSSPEIVRSRFNASYATILNLYESHGEDLLNIYTLSFNSFQEKKKSGASRQLLQMKTRLKILKQLGYIHENKLTEKGQFAKKIHGYELPMAELYGYGVLEELSVRQLGILALAAVFEPRPKSRKKTIFRDEVKSIQRITTAVVRGIHQMEKKYGLNEVCKKFFYDLSDSMMSWMKEDSFNSILQALKVDEGEVIRYYRMSIQILREMIETPASDTLKLKIRRAISLIDRDVIDAEEQLRKTVTY